MAKGNMLLGYSRGSVGDVTFTKIKGQQVARARNRNPHNPRTNKQSLQRAIFAAAVKFYTRGNQNFYKFAFENKRQVESDYNAFMRENVKRAPAISREALANYDYPVFAPFIMAKGSMPTLENSISAGKAVVALGVDAPSTLPTTVGALTEALIASEAYKAGDILTLVTINSNFDGTYPSATGVGAGKPEWAISQIILSASSTDTLADTLGMEAANVDGALVLTDATGVTLLGGTYSAFVMVHTRNSDSGLKCSTQELVLNDAATTAYEGAQDAAYKSSVIASWQANGTVDAQPEAILQGSIAYGGQGSNPLITDYISYVLTGGTRYNVPMVPIGGGTIEFTYDLSSPGTAQTFLQILPATGVTLDTALVSVDGVPAGVTVESILDDTDIYIKMTAQSEITPVGPFVVKYNGLYVGTLEIGYME